MNTPSVSVPEAQANIFHFLAEIFFSHPSENSMNGVREMAEVLGIPCPGDLTLAELDQEYMELFVIPNPRYVAPYESVFRDRWLLPASLKRGSNPGETSPTIKSLVMGESTLQVQQSYLEAGVFPSADLPDHIGNELSFMAYLWAREADSPPAEAEALAELRKQFRQEHILKWIDELRERIVESDRLGYYTGALQIAQAMLELEP